jgi:Flp pilus assembly protein TadD
MSVSIKRDTAVILYYARRYEEALEESRKTIRIEPAFPGGYWALGLSQEALGQHAEAVAAFSRALELAPDTPRWLGALGHSYALRGDRTAATRILERLGELAQTRYVQPFDFALVYLAMGDTGAALERLEQAFKFRSYELVSMKVDPRFDPVRSDPRIGRLLKRMGLEIAMDLAV